MNWSQVGTILWLRWRLTRNQWSRGGHINAIVTMFATAIGLGIGLLGGVAGIVVGWLALSKVSPVVLLLVWDVLILGFLFLWVAGIVSEIQRSETIDIGRLLHLPISLRQVFLINYIGSHLNFSMVLFFPGMIGLCLGLVLGRGPAMFLLIPLVLGFVFMVTSWTYCLRGWLVSVMVNKRRRRAVIAGVTVGFIILCQVPNFVTHVLGRSRRSVGGAARTVQREGGAEIGRGRKEKVPEVVLSAHRYVPLLWVGNGAMSLAGGDVWPGLWGAAGAFAIGAFGVRRGYRGTINFYKGRSKVRRSRRRKRAEKARAGGRNFLERDVPGVPEEAGVLALGFFRSLMRAPEVKMALAMNVIIIFVFGGMMIFPRAARISEDFKGFAVAGAVVLTFFGLLGLMFNQFGLDRGGFRTLVLLPVRRRHILLGKNLAMLPIAVSIGLVLLVLLKLIGGVSWLLMLAGVLELLSAFYLLSILGNVASVMIPYRVAPGSLKPTKTSALTSVLLIGSHMLFPAAMAPIFLPAAGGLILSRLGWARADAATVILSAVVLLAAHFFYRRSLGVLGDLLARREKKILEVVTKEVE